MRRYAERKAHDKVSERNRGAVAHAFAEKLPIRFLADRRSRHLADTLLMNFSRFTRTRS